MKKKKKKKLFSKRFFFIYRTLPILKCRFSLSLSFCIVFVSRIFLAFPFNRNSNKLFPFTFRNRFLNARKWENVFQRAKQNSYKRDS